jgi:outer membrane protein W
MYFPIRDYVVGGLEGTLIAHAEPSEWCRLRAGVGAGAYFVDVDDDHHRGRYHGYDRSRDDVDDEFGLHVLAGADIIMYANMSFFVEVKHIFLESDARISEYNENTDADETRDEELDLDTTSVNLGFKVLF